MIDSDQATIGDPIGMSEAIAMTGKSKDTLIRMIARGEILHVHKLKGRRAPYILDRAEIEALAAKAAS